MNKENRKGLSRIILTLSIIAAVVMNLAVTGYAAGQISKVIAGYENTFIITNNGELFASGKNTSGQLGVDASQNTFEFISVLDGLSDVSSGGEHTLFLMEDNSLWASGNNGLGQLGDGTNDSKSTPVKVMENCISFSAGYSHSMAVNSANSLFGWGYNGNRILADGTNISKNTPNKIVDGIEYINVGMYYNLAIRTDNSLSILPDSGFDIAAAQVASGSNGKEHTLILSENNELFAFGYNAFGQLGDGSVADSNELVKVMDGVSQIAAGADYSMALKTDNTLWTWGNNSLGQLGDGGSSNKNIPVKIMDDVVQISASNTHSAALKSDGSVYVWGSNSTGQFGNTASANSNVPVLVDISEDISSDWAYPEILSAKKLGIVPRELQSKYRQATTRSEFCSLAVALYETVTGSAIVERASFSDTNDVNVQKAAAVGIVFGVGDNRFSPNAPLTREQAATMLGRIAEITQKPLDKQASTFSDNGSISEWAIEGVGQVQAAGVMGGIGDNVFAPANSYTREQSITTMLRMYDIVK